MSLVACIATHLMGRRVMISRSRGIAVAIRAIPNFCLFVTDRGAFACDGVILNAPYVDASGVFIIIVLIVAMAIAAGDVLLFEMLAMDARFRGQAMTPPAPFSPPGSGFVAGDVARSPLLVRRWGKRAPLLEDDVHHAVGMDVGVPSRMAFQTLLVLGASLHVSQVLSCVGGPSRIGNPMATGAGIFSPLDPILPMTGRTCLGFYRGIRHPVTSEAIGLLPSVRVVLLGEQRRRDDLGR